ncbi:hypothetical protein ASD15_14275 [Massilia sp. Root351]|jgi:hypothetical protein|uniref:hypothetical protein n=1 Tax=Massilia sp. Root351 TaxID=1736522 RepID=UPI00070BBE64|nr:hypothetical protein [Massilia sp. Root351]KQV81043.1 hypothetical protein ASD15_14275 [Massilia sp. Root351]
MAAALTEAVLSPNVPGTAMPVTGKRMAGMLARYPVRAGAKTWRALPLPHAARLTACATAASAWPLRHVGGTTYLQKRQTDVKPLHALLSA